MGATLAEIGKDIEDRLKAISAVSAKATSENRELNDDERDAADKGVKAIKELQGTKAKLEDSARLKAEIDQLTAAEGAHPVVPAKGNQLPEGVGDAFTKSDQFKSFMSQFPDGRIPEGAKGISMPPVPVGGMKTLFSVTAGHAPGMVREDYRGLTPVQLGYPLRIRDVVTIAQTSSDTIEWVEIKSLNNAAAPVPEATTLADGVKPESGLDFQRQTTPVRTIAHWLPITKRALADVPQIRSIIDTFLVDGLYRVMEDQLVNGDGTGENFQGFMNNVAIPTVAFSANIPETVRKSITAIQGSLYQPNTILMSPQDAETVDLMVDGNQRYYGQGPFGAINQPGTLWGVQRIISDSIPTGTALIGDFRESIVYDREASNISVSDSHSDFFIKNMIAILAELRAAFTVRTPTAFRKVALA